MGTLYIAGQSSRSVLVQVPIHTVTLDVQDFDKLQQLPDQLPADFQEVEAFSHPSSSLAAIACVLSKGLAKSTSAC